MRQIVLDIEKTGLNPYSSHRVVEIFALEMIDRSITGEKFHTLLNPHMEIDSEIESLLEISNKSLSKSPSFEEIANGLLDFLAHDVIVLFNYPFVLRFLNKELEIALNESYRLDNSRVINLMSLTQEKFPGSNKSIRDLARHLKINIKQGEKRGVVCDSYLCADIYNMMVE